RRAPLGLSAFARIVDDVGINMRQILQDDLRITSGAEGRALAGQPLQVAVLAEMEDGICGEDLVQPAVEGDIERRRCEVGTVVAGGGVRVETAGRLDAEEDVAQQQPRDGKAAVVELGCALRLSPAARDAVAGSRRYVCKPGFVLRRGHPTGTARMGS